ncbi:MAG: NADAR family protein [Magnetococcales bacterium]|nr:NADAR family protein [Magnetococcales bacterium]
MSKTIETRHYRRSEAAVFLKTQERFGGLSNMAGGFPLNIGGVRVLSSEALYQACRYPHMPDVQKIILDQSSPMTAKMKTKRFRLQSRPDWEQVRVRIMRWCLRVKLAQHRPSFTELLFSTGELPIVEESRKDSFWGAKPVEGDSLEGMNVLGRLLMELREIARKELPENLRTVEPPNISNFLLLGQPIGRIGKEMPMVISSANRLPLFDDAEEQVVSFPPPSITHSSTIGIHP